jgi:RNase P protein component
VLGSTFIYLAVEDECKDVIGCTVERVAIRRGMTKWFSRRGDDKCLCVLVARKQCDETVLATTLLVEHIMKSIRYVSNPIKYDWRY